MRRTAKEIADSTNAPEVQSWLETANVKELADFRKHRGPNSLEFALAETYLAIRLANNAKSKEVAILVVSVAVLVVALLSWLVPFEKKPQIPKAAPSNKAASFGPSQSNLPPVPPTK